MYCNLLKSSENPHQLCPGNTFFMSCCLRRVLLSPTKKVQSFTNDISQIWDKSPIQKSHVQISSNSAQDIISILMRQQDELKEVQSPRKRLYCPPVITQSTLSPAPKPKPQEFLYRRVCITSPEVISMPDEIQEAITYVYKGDENQEYVLNDFLKKLQKTHLGVITVVNMVLYFQNGQIQAKGITGSAQKRILSIKNEENQIDFQAAIEMVKTLVKTERIELYSTFPFHYATNIPIRISQTQFQNSKGQQLYRTVLAGTIFAFSINSILSKFNNQKFQKETSLLY